MDESELYQIIKKCVDGDRDSQKWIFSTYSPKMMTVCLRYTKVRADAEDVLQDAFVKVFTKMNQFSFNGSFEGWIRRIIVHTAIRFLEYKRQHVSLDMTSTLKTEDYDPYNNEKSGDEQKILAIINTLPFGYRTVINMYVFEGFDHSEIAEILNISASTSRSQLTKARKLLKEELNKRNLI